MQKRRLSSINKLEKVLVQRRSTLKGLVRQLGNLDWGDAQRHRIEKSIGTLRGCIKKLQFKIDNLREDEPNWLKAVATDETCVLEKM